MPRAWAAAARRYRRDGATAAAPDPAPRTPRAAAKMAEGPRPAPPHSPVSHSRGGGRGGAGPQAARRKRRGRMRTTRRRRRREGQQQRRQQQQRRSRRRSGRTRLPGAEPSRRHPAEAARPPLRAAMATGRPRDSLTAPRQPHGPETASRPARPAGSAGWPRDSLPAVPRLSGQPRGLGGAAGAGQELPRSAPVPAVPGVKQRSVPPGPGPRGDTVFVCRCCYRIKTAAALVSQLAPVTPIRWTDKGDETLLKHHWNSIFFLIQKGWEIPNVEFFCCVCRRSDRGSASKLTTTFCQQAVHSEAYKA